MYNQAIRGPGITSYRALLVEWMNMTAKFKTLSERTIANGLGLNPSKTELVLFTNRYKIPQLNPPILNNCNLSFSDHAGYLGLVLDKRLKLGLNNKKRTKKATIALYSCKKAIRL